MQETQRPNHPMFKSILSRVLPQVRRPESRTGSQDAEEARGTVQQQEHPQLAIGHGRCNIRGYIKSFTKRLQNAFDEQGGMGRVLQPTTRISQTEGSREAEERRSDRALEVIRISKDSGYKAWLDLFESIEGDAYYSLRVPHEVRMTTESLDYFIGYQAGRLAVVDDVRVMVQQAQIELKRQKDKQQEEYERQQRTKSN